MGSRRSGNKPKHKIQFSSQEKMHFDDRFAFNEFILLILTVLTLKLDVPCQNGFRLKGLMDLSIRHCFNIAVLKCFQTRKIIELKVKGVLLSNDAAYLKYHEERESISNSNNNNS